MKKLGTLLLLSTVLVAGAAQAAAKTNWLAGVSAGWADRSGSFAFDRGFNQNNPIVDFNAAGDIDHDSFLYGVFAGVQTLCNNWVWGVEFAMDWMTNDDTSNIRFRSANAEYGRGTAIASFDRDTVYTLSTRLGYAFSCWRLTPYFRIGVETSRDFLDTTVNLDGAPAIPVLPGDIAYLDGSNRTYRMVVGAGLEVPFTYLSKGASVRVEYNYSTRGEGTSATDFTHDKNPAFNSFGGVPLLGHTKQHVNSVRASLAYNFL